MKKFSQYIDESGQDMLGLHDKKVPIKTKDFEGNAHIQFDRIKSGKHQTHNYRVTFDGTHHGEKHTSSDHMDVEHDNGRAYKYKCHPSSSKDLSSLLHKAAPRWVDVK